MNSENNNIVNDLKNKITKLVLLYEEVKEVNTVLNQEVEENRKKLEDKDQKILQLERKYINLKSANALVSSEEDQAEAKSKINKLVREIDKCMALMNE